MTHSHRIHPCSLSLYRKQDAVRMDDNSDTAPFPQTMARLILRLCASGGIGRRHAFSLGSREPEQSLLCHLQVTATITDYARATSGDAAQSFIRWQFNSPGIASLSPQTMHILARLCPAPPLAKRWQMSCSSPTESTPSPPTPQVSRRRAKYFASVLPATALPSGYARLS